MLRYCETKTFLKPLFLSNSEPCVLKCYAIPTLVGAEGDKSNIKLCQKSNKKNTENYKKFHRNL